LLHFLDLLGRSDAVRRWLPIKPFEDYS
jgi:hypothetical protein